MQLFLFHVPKNLNITRTTTMFLYSLPNPLYLSFVLSPCNGSNPSSASIDILAAPPKTIDAVILLQMRTSSLYFLQSKLF